MHNIFLCNLLDPISVSDDASVFYNFLYVVPVVVVVLKFLQFFCFAAAHTNYKSLEIIRS